MRTRHLTAVVLLAILSLLFSFPAHAFSDPQRKTPEGTMSLFWQLFKRYDRSGLDLLGAGDLRLTDMVAGIRAALPSHDEYWYEIYRTEVNDDVASVWTSLTFGNAYRFDLIRANGEWGISAVEPVKQLRTNTAHLELEIMPDRQRAEGLVRLTVTPERENLTCLPVRIADDINIDGVKVNGIVCEVTRYPGRGQLTIATPRLPAGQQAEVVVAISGTVNRKGPIYGRLVDAVGKDGSYLSLPLGLTEAEAVEASITVPTGQVAVFGGKLVDQQTQSGNRITYHYQQSGRTGGLAVGAYRAVETSIGKVAAHVNTLPKPAGTETTFINAFSDAIAYFTDRLGPYPYADLTVTQLPLAHGSAISQPGHIMIVSELTPAAVTPSWTNLAYREAARQWVGQLGEESHPWCSSALAVYLGDLCQFAHCFIYKLHQRNMTAVHGDSCYFSGFCGGTGQGLGLIDCNAGGLFHQNVISRC
jgi:hypothetical protein